MAEFVRDDSLALTWHFRDEADPHADVVAACFPATRATVPAICPLEIANAVRMARHKGRGFNSAAWLDKAKQSSKEELKQEVYKHLTGEEFEPYEMVYFKLYESQLPTVERALLVAARMVGTKRSRGYCLELVCANFLAVRTEKSTPDLDADSPSGQVAAAGIPDAPCRSRAGGVIGDGRKMLKKVKPIKLGRQVYRRFMKRVLERGGWRCQKCGSLENLQVHHQIKRSQQGDDALANLVTLCAYCYMAEHGQLFYSVPALRICSKAKPRGN